MKRGFRKMSLIAAMLLALCANVMAQQSSQIHSFSIKEAVDYAAKNNVQVKNALLSYKIRVQENRAITAQALPQINGSLSLTDNILIPTTLLPGEFVNEPGKYIPVQFGTQYNANVGATLQQVLFDGQVFVGLKARQTALDYYGKSAEVTEQNIRVNVYKVYYQLLLSRTQVAIIDANITRSKELLHNTSELYKNGFSEKLDVDKISVQLANFESQKVQTNYVIDNGYLGLKMLIGMPIKDSLLLTDSLNYEMVRDASLNDIDYKYSDRREFQLLSISKKLNEFDILRYKKMYIPTASLAANITTSAYRTEFDIFGGGHWYPSSYVGLTVNVPIFDGFLKDANIQKSKLALQQTENSIEDLKITIDEQVKEAQLRFVAAMNTLNSQKQNMDLATSVYEQTKKKYEQGIGSNTEITQAQTDLTSAQTNYLNALYNTVVAKIDYQNAIGKL